MIAIFQILFSIFCVLAIFSVWDKKKQQILGKKATLFWISFWLLVMVLVWWPNALTVIANKFGIGRGTDLVLYVSLVIIFFVLFKLNVKLEMINRDITKIVREKAVK